MPYRRSPIYFAMLFFMAFAGCGTGSGRSFVPSLPGYSEKQKQTRVLPKNLLEISGISYIGDNRLIAVNDEKGVLFTLNLENDSIDSKKFEGKGDYEDLVKTDSGYYVLDSKGDLYQLDENGALEQSYNFKKKGKREFESLVWYKNINKLVLITKEQRRKIQAITAFTFDLKAKEFDEDHFFEISFKEVYIKLENYNVECKPSAAALNPIDGKLYIVASVGKVLMQCSARGKLEKIYKLNPTHFPQPEGITFADNGDMYISNEGLEGKATILKFPHIAVQ